MSYVGSHPQELERDYPYKAQNGHCSYSSSKGKVKSTHVHHVTTNSVSQLKAALNRGPVAVSVEADKTPFHSYTGGVINTTACGINTDHAIIAVGYSDDYYIVRNSWGASWGEKGYVRIKAVDGVGICAIQKKPVYPDTN